MNMEVDRFFNDSHFTETAPRPPVPGEENELQSNGGISTKSSGSHKTHSSGKSERSNKSHSPAATPRRSNLDKTGGSLSCSDTKLNGEENAPLGFEPEGSAECGNSPPFVETIGTPPYSKWAQSLKSLLEDSEGVKLYKQFLDQEQCSNTLEFWFACRGIKLVQPSDTDRVASLIKLIYKKYIKGDQLKLDPRIKRGIAEKLKKEKYDQNLFEDAQANIEDVMRNDSYPLFLKSDIYVQFVQNGGESPKSSHSTSGSNSVRPLSGPLPTLHEEKELKEEDIKNTSANTTLPLNPNTLAATTGLRSLNQVSYNQRYKRYDGFAVPGNPIPKSFPYHVSYAPVSERDSENTSDAHTDDTMSLTDSSIDGRDAPYGSKRWKKTQKAMRNNQVSTNRSTGLSQHIPRTQRPAPRDRNLAETDPKAFAAVLIGKLEKHLQDSDRQEYVKSLNLEPTTDEELEKERTVSKPSNNNKTPLTVLMAMMESKEDDPQGILDDHFSRVWDSSSGQTPARSPGRHSPDRSLLSKSHFLGPSPNVSGTAHHPSFIAPPGNKSLHLDTSMGAVSKAHHRKKDKLPLQQQQQPLQDNTSLSIDSSLADEKQHSFYDDPYYNKSHSVQIHHHHHHHHHGAKDSKGRAADQEQVPHGKPLPTIQRAYPGAERISSTVVYDDRPRIKQSASGKRMSDSSATGDSGVYMYDQSALRVPNLHDPSNEKVLAWILDNEKISSGNNPQYSTDGSDRGSSHKRSHKSGGSSKKAFDPNRSAPNLEHSFAYPSAVANTSLPAQPIIQDPNMPLLNPPNTTVQLEETRRRLLDEDKRIQQQQQQAAMKQSKSFNSSLNTSSLTSQHKQRSLSMAASSSMHPPPLPPRGIPPKHASSNIPLDLSASEDLSGSFREKTFRKPQPPPPVASESTVVGYYFCGEPIPYRTTVYTSPFTLGQFKQLISKRGVYRYFFKKPSDEFDSGVVYEEVTDDNELLPLCEGKIIGKVEKVE